MKLAVLMDALENIKPYKDTTIAMMRSAQAMDWSCSYFTQTDLYCHEGKAYAQMHRLEIGDVAKNNWAKTLPLGEMLLVILILFLMRKDPPFDMEFIYSTYALELAQSTGVLVANRPQSLRDANEKFFTLNFPQCCPDTLVSKDIKRLKAFWQQHQNVIFKPLEGMGGSSVFHVDEQGRNLSVILELLTHYESTHIMAQRYIPEIATMATNAFS